MPSVQCICGQMLHLPDGTVGNFVCPTCGHVVTLNSEAGSGSLPSPPVKGHVEPAYAEPAYAPAGAAYPAPQQENSDAVLGFALAMISFFTCLLAAPFAVYYSIRGMGKSNNQGLAIAGLLIGISQSIALLIGLVYVLIVVFVLGGIGLWGISEVASHAPAVEEHVSEITQRQSAREHRPSPTTGLDSAAPIADVHEALENLKRPSAFDRKPGLNFLTTAKVEDVHRKAVVKSVLMLEGEILNQREVRIIVDRWASKSEVDMLIDRIKAIRGPSSVSRYGESLMQTVAKLDKEKLVPLTTHSDDHVARRALTVVNRSNVSPDALARHAIDALNEDAEQDAAIKVLKQCKPVESLRASLNKSIGRLTSRPKRLGGIVRGDLVYLLKKWGITEDALEFAAKSGEYQLVSTVHSRRTLELLGDAFRDFPIGQSKATPLLRKIGPAAESYVWPALQDQSSITVRRSLELLEEIGTQKSIPVIKGLSLSRSLQRDAERVIEKIRRSGRQPTQTWAN